MNKDRKFGIYKCTQCGFTASNTTEYGTCVMCAGSVTPISTSPQVTDEHICQYCGCKTTQSDDVCWANPNNKPPVATPITIEMLTHKARGFLNMCYPSYYGDALQLEADKLARFAFDFITPVAVTPMVTEFEHHPVYSENRERLYFDNRGRMIRPIEITDDMLYEVFNHNADAHIELYVGVERVMRDGAFIKAVRDLLV